MASDPRQLPQQSCRPCSCSLQFTTVADMSFPANHRPNCPTRWGATMMVAIDSFEARRCLCNIDSDGTPIYPDGEGAKDCPCCEGRGTVLAVPMTGERS